MSTLIKFFTISLLSLFAMKGFSAINIVAEGEVVYVENGWGGEGVAIHHTVGHAGCESWDSEYFLSKEHAGYNEVVSMILMAYSTSAKVELVVDTGVCLTGNRTKIISVRLKK